MKSHFRRVGSPENVTIKPAPETTPELGQIPSRQVAMTFIEGMPTHDRWLNNDEKLPVQTLCWHTDAFLLDGLPQRFDSWDPGTATFI